MSTQEHAASEHGPDEGHDDHHEEMVIFGKEVGPKHYWKIWGLLLALLIVSFVGPYAEIQVLTLMTAFGIAVVKAYLVCKHFMHLDLQPKWVIYFLVTALVLMGLFFFGTAPDVLHHEGENWANRAAQEHVEAEMIAQGLVEGGEGAAGAFDAGETFTTVCGACHGAGGAGDGAPALDPPPANFTDPAFWATGERDRDHLIQTIREGGASVGRSAIMPAFGQYDEEQAGAIADYIMENFRP